TMGADLMRRRKFAPSAAGRAVLRTRLAGVPNDGSQEAACRAKAAAIGVEVVAVFHDDKSGDRLDRDGLWSAIDVIKEGRADLLLVHSFDRLSRSQFDMGVIVNEVHGAGGEIVSATQGWMDGPTGLSDFAAGVAWMAQYHAGYDAGYEQCEREHAAEDAGRLGA
ncbi:MAG: recombinase family protein, partial [Thermomicrobiales bacterium]